MPRKPGEYTGSHHYSKMRRMHLKAACEACGDRGTRQRPLQIDHITPRALGGSQSDTRNWQTLCFACNETKGSRLMSLDEIRAIRGTPPPAPRPLPVATVRSGPISDPDGIEVQMRLPLIDRPHDHTDYIGLDRHTALFADGAMFRVCPHDCPSRSRLLVPR